MSVTYDDISYDLIDGIYDVLNTHTTYGGTTYPVYKSIPKTPASIYVFVGNIVETENGTKDDFMYEGTIQIHVVDSSKERGDLKLAQGLMNVVRQHLKATRAAVFTIGSHTLITFTPESSTTLTGEEIGISKIRMVDIYNFLIQ
jgi:hypothetical protein